MIYASINVILKRIYVLTYARRTLIIELFMRSLFCVFFSLYLALFHCDESELIKQQHNANL